MRGGVKNGRKISRIRYGVYERPRTSVHTELIWTRLWQRLLVVLDVEGDTRVRIHDTAAVCVCKLLHCRDLVHVRLVFILSTALPRP